MNTANVRRIDRTGSNLELRYDLTVAFHKNVMSSLARFNNFDDLTQHSHTSPHTRSCLPSDVERLLAHTHKSLRSIGLGDLRNFDAPLIAEPDSRVPGTNAGSDNELIPFRCRTRYLAAVPLALSFAHIARVQRRQPKRFGRRLA